MGRYLLRRVLVSIPVLIGITLLTFLFINLAPGDPVSMLIDPDMALRMPPEWFEVQRVKLGLDKPLMVRYFIWLGELFQGNLGYSITRSYSVWDMISERLWNTAKLMGLSLIVGVLLGIAVGILSAVKRYSLFDHAATFFIFLMVSIPGFFKALLFIFVFALALKWLPTSGMNTIGAPPSLWDSIRHLILPVGVLSLGAAAPIARYMRTSLLEVLHEDFVRAARAKGLTERVLLLRHAIPNALIPVLTIVGKIGQPSALPGRPARRALHAWERRGRGGRGARPCPIT